MAGWDTKPVNGNEYTVVVGTTTGNYNNGNPDTYVKTWMEFKVMQNSTDVANNQSRVDVKLYSQVISGGSGTGMANTYTANNYGYAGFDNSNKQYLNTTYDFNNFSLNKFADTILTIPHNADGTKTINLQAAFTTLSGTWSITGGSASTTLALPTIAKGTTLTNITNRYYGYPATFELSRKASNFWEQVWIEYGGYSYHVVNNQSNPNFTYTIPRECTPNTAKPSSSSWTITIYTYNGSTLVDTKSYSGWTWEINPSDTSYLPTLSTNPTFAPYNDVVSQFGTYVAVAGYSKVRLSATKAQVSCKYGASVVTRSVTFSSGGGTVSDVNASTYTSNKYTAAGNITCTYTFTDSRGFSNSWTSLPISVNSYSAPTLNVSRCFRGDSAHNESDSGTYAWGQATYGICTLAGGDGVNRNSVTSFKAQVTGFSAVNLTNNTLAQLASGLSLSSVYTVTFSVTDITGNTATETRQIPSEDIPINIREGGKGVGIGAYATESNVLKVGYDAKFYGDVIKHDSVKNIDVDIVKAYEPLVAYGTEITANANLNTSTYVNVGLYYRADNATVATFSNCPTTVGFSMIVRNVNKTDVNSSAKTWQYLTREITDINGNQFIQTAFCGSTVGTWVFGEWKQKTTLNASATVTTKYFTVPTANVWQQIHSTSVSAGLFYVRARASFSYARPLAIALIGYDGNGKQYSRNDNVSKDYGGILIDGNSMSWLETSAIIKTSGATTIYVYVAYASATNNDSTLEFELQKLA